MGQILTCFSGPRQNEGKKSPKRRAKEENMSKRKEYQPVPQTADPFQEQKNVNTSKPNASDDTQLRGENEQRSTAVQTHEEGANKHNSINETAFTGDNYDLRHIDSVLTVCDGHQGTKGRSLEVITDVDGATRSEDPADKVLNDQHKQNDENVLPEPNQGDSSPFLKTQIISSGFSEHQESEKLSQSLTTTNNTKVTPGNIETDQSLNFSSQYEARMVHEYTEINSGNSNEAVPVSSSNDNPDRFGQPGLSITGRDWLKTTYFETTSNENDISRQRNTFLEDILKGVEVTGNDLQNEPPSVFDNITNLLIPNLQNEQLKTQFDTSEGTSGDVYEREEKADLVHQLTTEIHQYSAYNTSTSDSVHNKIKDPEDIVYESPFCNEQILEKTAYKYDTSGYPDDDVLLRTVVYNDDNEKNSYGTGTSDSVVTKDPEDCLAKSELCNEELLEQSVYVYDTNAEPEDDVKLLTVIYEDNKEEKIPTDTENKTAFDESERYVQRATDVSRERIPEEYLRTVLILDNEGEEPLPSKPLDNEKQEVAKDTSILCDWENVQNDGTVTEPFSILTGPDESYVTETQPFVGATGDFSIVPCAAATSETNEHLRIESSDTNNKQQDGMYKEEIEDLDYDMVSGFKK